MTAVRGGCISGGVCTTVGDADISAGMMDGEWTGGI